MPKMCGMAELVDGEVQMLLLPRIKKRGCIGEGDGGEGVTKGKATTLLFQKTLRETPK